MGKTTLGTQRILFEQKKSFLHVQNHKIIVIVSGRIINKSLSQNVSGFDIDKSYLSELLYTKYLIKRSYISH